jgi:hypothetical protein
MKNTSERMITSAHVVGSWLGYISHTSVTHLSVSLVVDTEKSGTTHPVSDAKVPGRRYSEMIKRKGF